MSPPRSTAPGDWAPSRAWINIGPYRPGGLRSRGRLATWIFRSIPSSEAAIQYSLATALGEMGPQRRALKVRVHYWAAASLLKSVLRDSLSPAAVVTTSGMPRVEDQDQRNCHQQFE